MADRDELRALAQRVMALAGPCIAIDADVELAVGGWTPEHYEAWHRYQECGEAANPPFAEPSSPRRFTASLDAAMTLGRQFLLVAMSDIAADGLPGVCLCSDTSTSPPKEHWGIALGGASGPREQVLARCYTAAALLALADQVPE